jgi:hypothetical protein
LMLLPPFPCFKNVFLSSDLHPEAVKIRVSRIPNQTI